MIGWWLCWLPVVELMVGRPVMRVVVVAEGHSGEERRERTVQEKKLGRRLVCSDFLTRFSPPLGHQIRLYL
jgi:hypothetical protein